MPEFDEQAAHLPPPRADEPANLRREIIDELSDHLTCARKREQLAGGPQTEEAIQHRVLDRFGDPAAVARKLWLDWMWEKIMTQRILTAVCILLTVLTCAALAFAWVSINRQQDLIADLQLTSKTQLQEQQKQFERLLAAAQSNKAPSDWNPVELRFVKGKEDGPPAEGIKVTVAIEASETGIPKMEAVSDDRGVVHFDRVRYGTYTVTAENSANEKLTTSFTLQPGESLQRTIVCPEPPTERTKVTASIIWPEDLEQKPIWFSFQWDSVYRTVAGNRWKPDEQVFRAASYGRPQPVFAPNGDVLESRDFSRNVSFRVFGQANLRGLLLRGRGRGVGDTETAEPVVDQRPEGIDWPGPEYRIQNGSLLLSISGLASPGELLRLINNPPPDRGRASTGEFFRSIRVSPADWTYRLEAGQPGKPAILKLTPTAEAVAKVREALPEFEKARAYQQELRARDEQRRIEADQARTESTGQQPKSTTPAKKPDTDP